MMLPVISVLFVFGTLVTAFPGEFVAKSYYLIDNEGRESEVVPIRSRRDLLRPLLRFRRGGGSAQASASSSSHASSSSEGGTGGQYGHDGYNPAVVFPDLAEFAQNFPAGFGHAGGGNGGGQGGAYSFASSHSSSSSGGGSGGSSHSSGRPGGLGAGHDVGYKGPILFSRFGEDEGTGVDVSGSAQGPQGAFSASSSSIDGNGKIKYSVQSGKY